MPILENDGRLLTVGNPKLQIKIRQLNPSDSRNTFSFSNSQYDFAIPMARRSLVDHSVGAHLDTWREPSSGRFFSDRQAGAYFHFRGDDGTHIHWAKKS